MSTDPIRAAMQLRVNTLPPPAGSLTAHFTPRSLSRGEHWLRTGEVCRKFAFVVSGSLRLYVESDKGEHTRWAFFEQDFFTALGSFTDQTASQEAIQALEPTELLELPREQWIALHEQEPFVQAYWTTSMGILNRCFEDRLNAFLHADGAARYQYLLDKHPDFVLRLPQKYLAQMLGMAPRHLSRIRKELAGG